MTGLAAFDFDLRVDPDTGCSVSSLEWRGMPLLRRAARGGDVLSSACFPLVPFSNRIAGSAFEWQGRTICLAPNHPGDASSPVIHGIGWLKPWEVASNSEHSLVVKMVHSRDESWPWSIEAVQQFELAQGECCFRLTLTNRDSEAMPAGLGFHPYFPRNGQTLYRGLHRGEWQNDDGCIPIALKQEATPTDWWGGRPVGSRCVDTVYTQREGPLTIEWPDKGVGLELAPDGYLPFTTVYVPEGEDYFCVEPVSHMTDAFNRHDSDGAFKVLAPGEEWSVSMRLRPYML